MPNERTVFIGDVALEQIGRMVRADSQYEIHVMETEYGIKITSIVTVFGTLRFMTHPMMSESPVWTKEMYVFHMGGLARRTFRATFEENYDEDGLRPNGVDADEGLMTTEMGVQCGAARTMGIYRNIQKGGKSN